MLAWLLQDPKPFPFLPGTREEQLGALYGAFGSVLPPLP